MGHLVAVKFWKHEKNYYAGFSHVSLYEKSPRVLVLELLSLGRTSALDFYREEPQ